MERVLADAIARLAYAAIALGVTYLFARWLGLDEETAKEVSVLNAGVAYYTHEAAGRVVDAINSVYSRIVGIRKGGERQGEN